MSMQDKETLVQQKRPVRLVYLTAGESLCPTVPLLQKAWLWDYYGQCRPLGLYAVGHLSELDIFNCGSPMPTRKVTAMDSEVERIFQAVLAETVNKLGSQKCDGEAFPPGVHRPSRTFMSHYSLYSSLCPNKSETLCRDGMDHHESFVGIFLLQAQIMEPNCPIWLFCKRTHSGKLFSQASQRSL